MTDFENDWPPKAPSSLPERHARACRGGGAREQIVLPVRVVTPIFGGSPETRKVDQVDVIRPASIRGHLRFWWRALVAHGCENSKDLFRREAELWGGPTGSTAGGRSPVEIRVDVKDSKWIDSSEPNMRSPDGYALFPARGERSKGTPPGERRVADVEFDLLVSAPIGQIEIVRATMRAWLLFGGYGGRTRRGLGSMTARTNKYDWLPVRGTRESVFSLFGPDVFVKPGPKKSRETPTLAGCHFKLGPDAVGAEEAWTVALSWLRDFRQGTAGIRAREPSSDRMRPSISNWPEADKVRRLSVPPRGLPWAHSPRHNEIPAWPRAALGLPIIGQFQQFSREEDGNLPWTRCRPAKAEPDPFEIQWHDGTELHDRLASPLIVKPLALSDGRFVPIALWLNRADPSGQVILRGRPGSGAPFDRLVAPGDVPHFAALAGQPNIRTAFFNWLETHPSMTHQHQPDRRNSRRWKKPR